MKTLFNLAVFPLLCMGVIILTAIVIIFALRRGTKTINEQAEQVIAEKQNSTSANTRWARGDLQGEPGRGKKAPKMIPCPSCGGENPAGSSACAFCGRKL